MALQERGLGTALSSILDSRRASERLHALIPPAAEPVPDLCAFVFQSPGEGLQIAGSCDPVLTGATFAFDLLDAVRPHLAGAGRRTEFAVGDLECVAVPFAGPRTRGLLVLGRAGEKPDNVLTGWARSVCRALGAMLEVVA